MFNTNEPEIITLALCTVLLVAFGFDTLALQATTVKTNIKES